jgi:hypothetical protein
LQIFCQITAILPSSREISVNTAKKGNARGGIVKENAYSMRGEGRPGDKTEIHFPAVSAALGEP